MHFSGSNLTSKSEKLVDQSSRDLFLIVPGGLIKTSRAFYKSSRTTVTGGLKTVGDKDSVKMEHLSEMAYGESNGHALDDIR